MRSLYTRLDYSTRAASITLMHSILISLKHSTIAACVALFALVVEHTLVCYVSVLPAFLLFASRFVSCLVNLVSCDTKFLWIIGQVHTT